MMNITKLDSGWTAEIDGQTVFIPNDPENEQCREIMARVAGGLVVSAPTAAPVSLSKTEFCRALYAAKILPADLVVDAALGKWPAPFEAALVGLPEAERVDAKLAWAGATHVSRVAPLFQSLLAFFAAKQSLSAAEAEAFGDNIFAQTK